MSNRKWVTEPDVYVCPLTKEAQDLAMCELREDDQSRDSALESMRDWIKQNPRIKNCRLGTPQANELINKIYPFWIKI